MRALLLIAAIGLAACRPAAAPGPVRSDAFARELAGRVAGPPQSCISSISNQNLRVVDSSTLAYGFGSTVYVNRLDAQCATLNPQNTLIVEAQSGQYCSGDRVRELEPGMTIPGRVCILREWVPYRRP